LSKSGAKKNPALSPKPNAGAQAPDEQTEKRFSDQKVWKAIRVSDTVSFLPEPSTKGFVGRDIQPERKRGEDQK
jgi:hypothetical protein